MLFLLCFAIHGAGAATPDEVVSVVSGAASYRSMRTTKGAPVISEAEIRKAASGSVVTGVADVPGSKLKKVYAAAVLGVPISRFWAGLNDETRHPGYTSIGYSELVKGKVCASGRRVLQYLPIPVPLVPDRWWIGVLTINDPIQLQSGGAVRELSWRSSVDPAEVTTESGQKIIRSASPITRSEGGWFLVAIDDRTTYLEYVSFNDPGGNIPAGVAASLATKGVRENIAAIERFSKEGNPSCPIR